MIFWRSWWSRSHRRAEPGRGATTQAACRQRGVLRSCGCGRGRGHDGRSGARWRQLGSERRGSPAHRPGRWARAVGKSGVCLKETLDGALHEPARPIDGGDGGRGAVVEGGRRDSGARRDRLVVAWASALPQPASLPPCSGTSGTSGFFLPYTSRPWSARVRHQPVQASGSHRRPPQHWSSAHARATPKLRAADTGA